MEKNQHKPEGNERLPGQGNSNQGVERRYGNDTEGRGERSQQIEDQEKLTKVEERVREGSQGDSQGQHG